ncbi:hypothetical protein EB796_005217 [Bugula neritina]|uniref:Major facilitator superfamily (MFS) profile domain-containing protein n=1 Tax=Bugula neritina TaxID=10212 RepID=A0A7J7KDW4_BUGNE|nr:hypothetical protein EB796_005217 [Bugula neritina]
MGLRSLVSSIYVEPIMFIYMICLYYLIPATSSLYMYKVCRTVHNYSTDLCRDLVNAKITANNTAEEDVVSKGGSLWLFYQTICFTIPSTIVTLLLGLYGDRKGRKIPMILPCIGQGLGCLYYILMAKMDMLNVSYMVVGAFITGASGGFASIIMASFSHLSTTTSGADRTIRIVILQCIMGVGTALGSFTVGSLVNTPDDPIGGWVRTFGMITGLSMLCIVYILIRFHSPPRLHRSYDDISSSAAPSADPQGFASRINIVKVLSTVCQGFPSVLQLTLAAIWFAWVTGLGEFDVLFTYTQRMGLDRSIYGYYTGYGAIVQAIAGAVSVLLFKRFLDMSDSVLALIGLFSACLELLFLGLSGFFGGSSVVRIYVLFSKLYAAKERHVKLADVIILA